MPSIQEIMVETENRMGKSVDALSRELDAIRTGRASPALLDNLTVDYYGAPRPSTRSASISVPEPRVLMVQPWDKQALQAIEKGILKSDLGLVPNTDGTVVRIVIPTLTEERRRDLVRVVKAKVERVPRCDPQRPPRQPGKAARRGEEQRPFPRTRAEGPRLSSSR